MWTGGKASTRANLAMIPKVFNWVSNLCETQIGKTQLGHVNMGLRGISSVNGTGSGEYPRKEEEFSDSDFNEDDDDDKFLSKDAVESSPSEPIPGRPMRGGGRMPQLNLHQDITARKQDFSADDRLGYGQENKTGPRPSIRDLFNRPEKDPLANAQEQTESAAPPAEGEKYELAQDAEAIFDEMKKTGLIPNAVSMLDGLCKDGLVHEALKLFATMRKNGSMPEVVIYTAVVDGFFQAQKPDDALRIFRKMEAIGITPNAYTYSVLIRGLCEFRRLEEALGFIIEMVKAGHMLNAETFTAVVEAFCNEKGVEEARKVIEEMKQKGVCLDEKAVRLCLNKKGTTVPMVWEAVFGGKKKVGATSF